MGFLVENLSTFLGDPARCLSYYAQSSVRKGAYIQVNFMPNSVCGDSWFGVYCNTQLCRQIFAPSGEIQTVNVLAQSGVNTVSVIASGVKGLMDNYLAARYYDNLSAQKTTIDFTWPQEIIGVLADGGLTSSWVLTGLSWSQVSPVPNSSSRGTLTVIETVVGSVLTIQLLSGSTVICSGSGSASTTITLAEQNNSGVSGSVAVGTPLASNTTLLYVRWPASMTILRDPTDTVTTPVGSVSFNENNAATWTEPMILSPGTYYYAAQPVSDTGVAGTATSAFTIVIPEIPEPPTNLSYTGASAGAPVVDFTPSATAGATYNAYLQTIGAAFLDETNVSATGASGATGVSLPAIMGYPGTVNIIIRAQKTGVEEKNGNILSVEFDSSGNYVPPRPNSPSLTSAIVSSGDTLNFRAIVSTAGQLVPPATVTLFTRTPSGSYNFASRGNTTSFSSAAINGKISATGSITLGSGHFYVTAKSYSAAGTASSGQAQEILVYSSSTQQTVSSRAIVTNG